MQRARLGERLQYFCFGNKGSISRLLDRDVLQFLIVLALIPEVTDSAKRARSQNLCAFPAVP